LQSKGLREYISERKIKFIEITKLVKSKSFYFETPPSALIFLTFKTPATMPDIKF
jgi:hypothetical protein